MPRFLKNIFWIARNTFVEAVRQKFFSFLLLLGVGLIALSLAMTNFDFGDSELKFIADFGFGGVFLFGSVLAVVMSVQLFFSEIENRTALTLLAKPVRRSEFLLGKFFGIWSLLGVFVVVMCAALLVVLSSRAGTLSEIAAARGLSAPFFDAGGLAVFALLQWLRLGVVAAMSIAVSSFAQTQLYAVVVSFCGVLLGQLQYIFADFASDEKTGAASRGFAECVSRVVPNLQLFNLGQELVLVPDGVPAGAISAAALCGVFWIAVFAAIGAAFFRSREI